MYSITNFKADLFNAMKSRPDTGLYGGLGNSQNILLWTPDKIQSFYNGIITANNLFYRELQLIDFARLIICEAMQESTGDFRLGVKPIDLNDHTSHGIIQVTPASVLLDYYNYGLPIIDYQGHLVLSSGKVKGLDLSDPGIGVIIWAWYTHNCVVMGVSMNEWMNRIAWNTPTKGVKRIYKNSLITWLEGPHNDCTVRTDPGFDHYYYRIMSYYTVSGFGDKAKLDTLLNTPLTDRLIGVYPMIDNKINNRDSSIGII
jgi:hypothetical protein